MSGDPINFIDPSGAIVCSPSACPNEWKDPESPCDSDPTIIGCDPTAYTPGVGGDNTDQNQGGGGNPFAALLAYANNVALQAVSVLDTGCNGLFGSDPEPGDELRDAVAAGVIQVAPFTWNPSSTDAPGFKPGVGAQYNPPVDKIQIASNRFFFTGILENGTSVLNTVDFSGLTMLQMQETIIIHEFMHYEGLIGADNNNQQIVLPNGQTVVGSTGLTQAIKSDCFGVKQ